ncbi:poly-beta-hydroxybutyrate polymerase N-terminal domain-containing protein [Castellaniella sp. UC4442_H9]|jgi:polyhydroxyalkanoate synthase
MKKGLRDPPPPGSSDAIVHQALAPSTHGIALASITAAYLDWACHVAASPDKQREMSGSAVRKLIAWCNYLYGSGGGMPAMRASPAG